MKRWMTVLILAMVAWPVMSLGAEPLHVYGPGGPAPAMRDAAAVFAKAHGIRVEVTAGPLSHWEKGLRTNGDVIYSGSENMMSSFIERFADIVEPESVRPLYLRPAAILVRPGNPRHIRGLRDLLKPGLRVLVVHGAGQIGMWEDIAGRLGNMDTVRALRSNIVFFARNSGQALKKWRSDHGIDAWIIFPIWAMAHPGVADVVPLEPQYRIYRDCGVALTLRGKKRPLARAFVDFLASPQGRKIFEKHGWREHANAR